MAAERGQIKESKQKRHNLKIRLWRLLLWRSGRDTLPPLTGALIYKDFFPNLIQ